MTEYGARLILGDCFTALEQVPLGSVTLAYLDPPFFTGRQHALTDRSGENTYVFDDTWSSVEAYRAFMIDRLVKIRDCLADDGSIFLHCDVSASHVLRAALDQVFGAKQFRSEIIWSYRRWSNASRSLTPAHQTIFYYSKTNSFKFNTQYGEYSATTNVDQLINLRKRDSRGKTSYALDPTGIPVLATEKRGVPMSDVWEIPYLNPKARERVGYPTQKPVLLLERIVSLASDEGDTVLDPFCGSGTTLVAAQLLDRRSIGVDTNPVAIELTRSRLRDPVRSRSAVVESGRSSFKQADSWALSQLGGLSVTPVHRNSGIDALMADASTGLVPVRVQRPTESLGDTIIRLRKAGGGSRYEQAVVVRTHSAAGSMSDQEPPRWVRIVDSITMQLEQGPIGAPLADAR